MESILFEKPIVLTTSLEDMKNEKEKEQAIRLLYNKDVIAADSKEDLKIIPWDDAIKKDGEIPCFYGSEAVCLYREKLGLPDVRIEVIDQTDVICETVHDTTHYDFISDILYLLKRVDMMNNRFNKLLELSMPTVILANEYRILRDYVERLQCNAICKPCITRTCEEVGDDGNIVDKKVAIHSLYEIEYDLVSGESKLSPEGRFLREIFKK